jgi:hypothetical protein
MVLLREKRPAEVNLAEMASDVRRSHLGGLISEV